MDIDAMKTSEIILTKIEAGEGMYLTNGEAFGREVYLGHGDKMENWREITEAEYERLTAENEEGGGNEG